MVWGSYYKLGYLICLIIRGIGSPGPETGSGLVFSGLRIRAKGSQQSLCFFFFMVLLPTGSMVVPSRGVYLGSF